MNHVSLRNSLGRNRLPTALCLFFLFFFFLFLNAHTGMVADDFIFCISRATWTRVTCVKEIFPSLQALYNKVNGRVFAHFFAMLFLLADKTLFNIINAAFSTLLFFILSLYLRKGREGSLFWIVFLFCAVWFFLPAYGQVFLWLTGSCNYSWTMLLSFLFLLPFYRLYRDRQDFTPGYAVRFLYLLLAFITGAWSENGGLAVLISAFGFLFLTVWREKKLPVFHTVAFLVCVGGFAFLMLSPSELGGRRGKVNESTLFHSAQHIFQRYPAAAWGGLFFLLVALLLLGILFLKKRKAACRLAAAFLCVGAVGLGVLLCFDIAGEASFSGVAAILSDTRILLLLAFCLWGNLMLYAFAHHASPQALLAALILGLSALASVAVFFFAVYFPARSACPFILYISLADALLLSSLAESGKPKLQKVLAVILIVLFVLTLPFAITDILQTDRFLTARQQYLTVLGETHPQSEAFVEPVKPRTKYPACWPGDEDHFIGDMGLYYGLRTVNVTEYANQP